MNMDKLKKSISYWYMRYLLVTELFMVEKWERHMFHVVALTLLIILSLFNQLLVVGGVRVLRQVYYYYTKDISYETLHENVELIPSEL